MRLERLVLHGFKSFADRTELRFHAGVTVIVGPNGCGKSNISDAIRWVLGEQRASAIRSSTMEDTIFQGTSERRQVNRAEVSLIFSNTERRLAVPFEEVDIRRVVFREGGSDYFLNGTACRLKDIFDLCRDTGLGANAYTVIEQRMVDAILSDRAEERRHLFEEAAGIGRYKDRRRSAARRLEAARTDLSRVEDIISEVETQVRSLARQRKRAERYRELRQRRLAIELGLAAAELSVVEERIRTAGAALAQVSREEPSARAELAAAEAELERHRVESTSLATARGEVASRLEGVTRRIADIERELAVATERRLHAERRLGRIAVERGGMRGLVAQLEAESQRLSASRTELADREAGARSALEAMQQRVHAVRAELATVRTASEAFATQEKELASRLARAEAATAGADARATDADERLVRLDAEAAELEGELGALDQQGDLFVQRARELAAARAELEAEYEASVRRLERLRAEEAAARRAAIDAENRADTLAARASALEAMVREHQGFGPVVAAALRAHAELDGLVGPLADVLRLPPDRAAAVEAALASMLQVLVVRDAAATGEIRAFLEREDLDGVAALLPRDAVPRVEAFLEAVDLLGRPPGEPTLLGRSQRLARLRDEAAEAARERDGRHAASQRLGERVAEAESAVRELAERLETAGLELRRAEADDEARASRRDRAERVRDELGRRRAELRELAAVSRAESKKRRAERAGLERQLMSVRQEAEGQAAILAERESAWDAVRDEEAELRVAVARLEAERAELDRRIEDASQSRARALRELEARDEEEREHRAELERLDACDREAAADLETHFHERDRLSAELAAVDERIGAARGGDAEMERRVRQLRATVESAAERRHKLEMERSEADAITRRVRDRLEAEWGRPYDELASASEPADGDTDSLAGELRRITADLDRLGAINMLAIEAYEEEKQRLEFLQTQRDDLHSAVEDLQRAIREINRTAKRLFTESFDRIRANFRRTFESLFEGGTCDLSLADPDDPLESAIEITASPRGKRTQRIHLLSGGERALTALSLLFAIYLVKPSPFCVLDEVDAPLDEANVARFVAMLQEFKNETQFIVITHNPRTIEAADWIYGVTMEEPGVSSAVSVRLDEVLAAS